MVVFKQIAAPSASAAVVTLSLADFNGWSEANAKQVVGLQWQFTGTEVDRDAGTGCPIDVTFTNIKFLP